MCKLAQPFYRRCILGPSEFHCITNFLCVSMIHPKGSYPLRKWTVPWKRDRAERKFDLPTINFEGICYWLVVEPTPLKNMLVNMGIFPNFRGEHKKYLSCHHLGKFLREVMLIFLLKTLKIPLLRDLMDDSCRKALAFRFVPPKNFFLSKCLQGAEARCWFQGGYIFPKLQGYYLEVAGKLRQAMFIHRVTIQDSANFTKLAILHFIRARGLISQCTTDKTI